MKTSSTDTVREFHEDFGHPINDVKDDIPLKIRRQRINLLFEELQELAVACDVQATFKSLCEEVLVSVEDMEVQTGSKVEDGDNVDKVEEIDAINDLRYINDGTALALGHAKNLDMAFADIHASNMSKKCANIDEVNDTIKYYVTKKGELESNIGHKPKGDKFIVYRISDDKILKNVHYKPVDLTKYV